MNVSRRALLGAALGSVAAAAGCARPVDPGTGGTSPRKTLNVGFLWTQTGDKQAIGESTRYEQGLRNGLLWVTSRTNQVGVRRIKTVRVDDKGDPAVAAAAAEDLVDRGCHILVGGFTDAVALKLAEVAGRRKALFIAATATADELTGINEYTFRDGPEITQLLTAAKTYVKPGGRLVVLAADKARAVKAAKLLGAATQIVAPATTKDFTAVAKQIKAARADQIFVDWPKPAPRLWAALPAGVEPITVLGPRSTWNAYGSAATGLRWVTPYVDGASNNNAYQALRAAVPNRRTDSGHAEGFCASQMIVRAFQYGPQSVPDMIKSLEGLEFGGVKGGLTIRPADHLLQQPLWGGRLTWVGASGVADAEPETAFPPSQTTPPVAG
jgi:branched-chain amino acid transport system substrate-binding protein